MLAKLIKYDLKATAKIFFLLHALYLAICLCVRILFMDRLDFSASEESLISSIAIMSSLILFLITAINLCTWLLITFRFYRNLFGREGYLSWTLPVTGLQHLWSKIISGYIYMLADVFLLSTGILILVTGKNISDAYSVIAGTLTKELGMSLSGFSVWMFFFAAFSCISTVIMTYFCIAIGQLFPGHRILCAIAAYFITTFIVQILAFVPMTALGIFPGYNFFGSQPGSVADYVFAVLSISLILMGIVTVLQYIVTHIILKKKVNLL